MSAIDDLGKMLMLQSLTHHVRETNAAQVDTGMQDIKGEAIKTGDVLQFWIVNKEFHPTKPEGAEDVQREVVVVQRNKEESGFLCVDYDIMEACPLEECVSYATILGSVHTDEGIEHLRKGLCRFDADLKEEES